VKLPSGGNFKENL